MWRKAKNTPYKHIIVAYGATMTGVPSQIAYACSKKFHHAIPLSWRLTTIKKP
jgi:hypothetical protein